MSLAAALLAKDHGGPQIRTLVLMWPVTDAGYDWDSYAEYGASAVSDRTSDEVDVRTVCLGPGAARQRPDVARAGFGRTSAGAAAYADRRRRERYPARRGREDGRLLDAAGVEVTTVRFNGVIHDWGMLNGFAGLHPTRTLVRLAGAVLRDYLRE